MAIWVLNPFPLRFSFLQTQPAPDSDVNQHGIIYLFPSPFLPPLNIPCSGEGSVYGN